MVLANEKLVRTMSSAAMTAYKPTSLYLFPVPLPLRKSTNAQDVIKRVIQYYGPTEHISAVYSSDATRLAVRHQLPRPNSNLLAARA